MWSANEFISDAVHCYLVLRAPWVGIPIVDFWLLQVSCRLVRFSNILTWVGNLMDINGSLMSPSLYWSSIRENFFETVPRAARFLSGTDAVINHTQIVASLGPVPWYLSFNWASHLAPYWDVSWKQIHYLHEATDWKAEWVMGSCYCAGLTAARAPVTLLWAALLSLA